MCPFILLHQEQIWSTEFSGGGKATSVTLGAGEIVTGDEAIMEGSVQASKVDGEADRSLFFIFSTEFLASDAQMSKTSEELVSTVLVS